MLLLCASERSAHHDCYFYKCPVDGRHPKNFIWCDDFTRMNINQRTVGNTRSANWIGECSIFADATSDSSGTGEHRRRELNNDPTRIASATTSDFIWFWIVVNMIVISVAVSLVMVGFLVGIHY